MSTPAEPGARFRPFVVDARVAAVHQRRLARVVFAVALVVGTGLAFVANEASRWERAHDLGVVTGRGDGVPIDVVDGAAARDAGVRSDERLIAIDGLPVRWRGLGGAWAPLSPGVFVDRHRLYLRAGHAQTTFALVADNACTERVLVPTGDPVWARDQHRDGYAGVGALAALVFAVLAGRLVARRRPTAVATSETLQQQSIVWPASALALVVPIWAHLLVELWLGSSIGGTDSYVATAAVLTGLPHLFLWRLLAGAGRSWARGDFTTPQVWWPVLVTAIVPGVVAVVPTVFVVLVSLAVYRGCRAVARRVVDEEAALAVSPSG